MELTVLSIKLCVWDNLFFAYNLLATLLNIFTYNFRVSGTRGETEMWVSVIVKILKKTLSFSNNINKPIRIEHKIAVIKNLVFNAIFPHNLSCERIRWNELTVLQG